MKTHTLLLLFMLTAAAEGNLEKRIYNGHDCGPKERLYHVKITDKDGGLCGGSLINRRWVLTARHCGEDPKGDLTLTLGMHRGPLEQSVQKITVDQQKKGFAFFTAKDDIMLLRLETDVPNLDFIQLPPKGCKRPDNGNNIKVGGFGLYTAVWNSKIHQYVEDGPTADDVGKKLQCATMTTIKCDGYFPFWPFTFNKNNVFCYEGVPGPPGPAGPPTKTDICAGDSGGGMEYGGRIYGVIIAGYDEMCGGPAEASDVCFYRKWINKVLTQKTYDLPGRDPVGDDDY